VVEKLSVMPREGEVQRLSVLKSCEIRPGKGVTLYIPDKLEVDIGVTTSQDLLLDLGAPLRRFYKEDDRMERMWGAARAGADDGNCFWNYFQYGLDFLISPNGLVTKIIAHSNIPGTSQFQFYSRCPWVLPSPSGSELDFTFPVSAFRSALTAPITQAEYTDEIRLLVPSFNPSHGGISGSASASGAGGLTPSANTVNGKKKRRSVSPASISAESTGEKVSEVGAKDGTAKVGEREDPPDAMVLDRAVEGGMEHVIGVGPSQLLGFDGLIIEEDQQSGGICSVLVWKEDAEA